MGIKIKEQTIKGSDGFDSINISYLSHQNKPRWGGGENKNKTKIK